MQGDTVQKPTSLIVGSFMAIKEPTTNVKRGMIWANAEVTEGVIQFFFAIIWKYMRRYLKY